MLFEELAFSLRPGQALTITGPNGSGKTTLLQITAGLLRPSAGEVRFGVDGVEVPAERRHLHVGLVAPYLNVYDGLTAAENLQFIARARRLRDREARVGTALERVGLAGRAADPVSTFSSGMKQRVKWAAAMLAAPVLLLLDEPTTNLDEAGVAMARELTQAHLARGGLVLLATNVAEEAGWCEREVRLG